MHMRCMRVAILDDIHDAWAGTAGVRRLRERAEVVIFTEPFGAPAKLRGFDVLIANRERTKFTRELLAQLTDVRVIVADRQSRRAHRFRGRGRARHRDRAGVGRLFDRRGRALDRARARRDAADSVERRRAAPRRMARAAHAGAARQDARPRRPGPRGPARRAARRPRSACACSRGARGSREARPRPPARSAASSTICSPRRTWSRSTCRSRRVARAHRRAPARAHEAEAHTSINTARGPIVDESALVAALREQAHRGGRPRRVRQGAAAGGPSAHDARRTSC